MSPRRSGVLKIAAMTMLLAFPGVVPCSGQGITASESELCSVQNTDIPPEYQYSRNMAILDRINQNGNCHGICAFHDDSTAFLLIPDSNKYTFWDLTDARRPRKLGSIEFNPPDSNYIVRDVQAAHYGDSIRLFFGKVYRKSNPQDPGADFQMLDVPFYGPVKWKIKNGEQYDHAGILAAGATEWTPQIGMQGPEMLYYFEKRLFLATNTDKLIYWDVPTATTAYQDEIALNAPSGGTLLGPPKNHEVKAWTLSTGERLVGIGNVRTGMSILEFDENWGYNGSIEQVYDFDRSLFPDTVINPYKHIYDTTFHYDTLNQTYLTDNRNNKWDLRICHSVIPYEYGNEVFVLTVDEYTNYPGGQTQSGMWIPELWEDLDFFQPNVNHATQDEYEVYYAGNRIPPDRYGRIPDEESYRRLNFLHRNHPTYPGVDPNRLQGAFLRIWDKSMLDVNDPTANGSGMIRNAYDVQESDTKPEGYVYSRDGIPTLSDAPAGLHEPTLVGNTLYLAGYNAGARILKLHGDYIKVRAYCRSEAYLSVDTNSTYFYARPDIHMYAKGIYRLIPDPERPEYVFGSDLYNGAWIFQYFDSTLTDTLTHVSFQDRIEIGTIDTTDILTFYLAEGGAVIADSAVVEFTDNTRLRWIDHDSLVVLGELHVGSVEFDTSYHPSKLYCASGGKIYLGGAGKVIDGLEFVHVATGGEVVIREGTTLNCADTSLFLVEGRLILESCSVNENFDVLVRDHGVLEVDSAATVTGLAGFHVADRDSKLTLGSYSVLKMRPAAELKVDGIVETSPTYWSRLQSMNAAPDSVLKNGHWWGLVLGSTVDTLSSIQHLLVHHGYPGMKIDDGTPGVHNCQFSRNMIGLTVMQGAPYVSNNVFRENTLVGLDCHSLIYNHPMDNTIRSNQNFGLNAQMCANYWFSNRLDSNYMGAYVYDNSSISFNRWLSPDPRAMCDNAHGNGFRYNAFGMQVSGNSRVELQCDNSVYGNYDWSGGYGRDLLIGDQCAIVGWGNYPDSIPGNSADTLTFTKSGSGVLQWSDPSGWNPSPPSDPVLLKTVSNPFRTALADAEQYKRQGSYSLAQADYASAATHASTPEEMTLCMHGWRDLVYRSERDSAYTGASNTNGYWNALKSALQTYSVSADSVWKRQIAAELLSVELVRKRDTTAATTVLTGLTSNTMPGDIRRRALLRSVYMHSMLKNDYQTAYSRFQVLEQSYSGSMENLQAKIILRLPIDSTDLAALAKLPDSDDRVGRGEVHLPEWISLEGPAPHPARNAVMFTMRILQDANLTAEVYDLSGRRRVTIPNQDYTAGTHMLNVDVSSLAPGSYVMRVVVHRPVAPGPFTLERQFVVVR